MRRWYGRSKTADRITVSKGGASHGAPPVFYARDKSCVRGDLADAQEAYEAALEALTDPNATPEQRAALAQSAVDRADWASGRLEEFVSFGSQRTEAQRELESIVEELRPVAEGVSRDPFRLIEVPEWTGGTNSAMMIQKTMPNHSVAVTPREKFVNYSLDYANENARGKAEAYERGLGYTKENADGLIEQIHHAVSSGIMKPYDVVKTEYGVKYKYRIPVTGPNGKTKSVIAVYQIDSGKSFPRLITNYLEAKKND